MCSCRCWTSSIGSTPQRPSTAPAGEAVGRAILRDLDVVETLLALHDQIKGLTLGIPDVRTDELPLRLQ